MQYEHAANACLTRRTDEALKFLESSIRGDRLLAVKAASDPDLAGLGATVGLLLDRMRDEEGDKTKDCLDHLEQTRSTIGSYYSRSGRTIGIDLPALLEVMEGQIRRLRSRSEIRGIGLVW